MRVCSAEALLVDVGELSRGDRVVSFLCAEHGRLRGVARGAQRKYSRFSGQLQPLATVQLTWFEKESSDLVRIRELEMIDTAEPLRRDLEGLLLTSYVAEHLSVFAQEREASPELYRLTRSVIGALEEGGDHEMLLRYFESWVLRLGGGGRFADRHGTNANTWVVAAFGDNIGFIAINIDCLARCQN